MVHTSNNQKLEIGACALWLRTSHPVVRMLLEKGPDINLLSFGKTELHMAAWSGHEAVIRLLVEDEADINGQVRDWT